MARAFWAFVAFNVYSLFLISAFQENTPYLFDAKLVAEMRAAEEIFDIRAWGWKDHYIWRLFSGVVVTAIAAYLAGAIALKNGAKVTLRSSGRRSGAADLHVSARPSQDRQGLSENRIS